MTKVTPTLYDYTEKAEFPHHLLPEIRELGISGADTPKEYGGKGLSITDGGAIIYELARGDTSIATFYLLHQSLGNYTILKLCQEELKQRILKDTVNLDKILAWGLTEPLRGSDAGNIETSAKRVEGGYILNGRKRWIGNATFADYVCIWARNDQEGGKV